jgi:hypothetical protein
MEYSVEELNSSNAQSWSKLNEENSQGSFYHTLKWKEAVDRFPVFPQDKPRHFIVYRKDEPVALCPLYLRQWKIKGIFPMRTLSYPPNENIIVSYPEDALLAKQIVTKCKEMQRVDRSAYTCISLLPETKNFFRSMNITSIQGPGFGAGEMALNLRENSPEMIWNSFLSRNDKRKINRVEKDGWKLEEAKSEEELRSFYEYYRANLQYLRARYIPEFSFFVYLMKTFYPNEMLVFLLRKDETVAGGGLTFLFERKKTMYCKYAALNRQVPPTLSPFFSLMWHMVKKASAMGYTTVSFGNSPPYPDIHYQIKAKFGCSFEPRYEVTFPRLGALINSAVTRLDSFSYNVEQKFERMTAASRIRIRSSFRKGAKFSEQRETSRI